MYVSSISKTTYQFSSLYLNPVMIYGPPVFIRFSFPQARKWEKRPKEFFFFIIAIITLVATSFLKRIKNSHYVNKERHFLADSVESP